MELINKDVFVFDLDDTLAQSKTNVDEEMCRLLHGILCAENYVGIISGCSYEQMQKQFVDVFTHDIACNDGWGRDRSLSEVLRRLYLMPSSGSELHYYSEERWVCAYKENLLLREKADIYNAFFKACGNTNVIPLASYGEIAEDRGGQITFSFFGQSAPLYIKKPWDPEQAKRLKVAAEMEQVFTDLGLEDTYEITVGGASSIDVTRKGRDKAYGLDKFLDHNIDNIRHYKGKINADKVLFVADAIFPGGNDYPVKQMGIDCYPVNSPTDTKFLLTTILKLF